MASRARSPSRSSGSSRRAASGPSRSGSACATLAGAGSRRLIDQNCRLAERLHGAVVDAPDLEALAPQSLSVVCFRAVPSSLRGDEVALDALNRSIVEQIQLGGAFFVAKTVVRGRTGFASASSTAGRGRRCLALVRLVRAEAARFIAEDEDETPLVRPLRSASHRWSAIQPAGQRRAAPSTKSGGHPTEKPSAQTEPIC